jgi:hypothetical protein
LAPDGFSIRQPGQFIVAMIAQSSDASGTGARWRRVGNTNDLRQEGRRVGNANDLRQEGRQRERPPAGG